ncbi:MAG: hypothetical protein MZU97_10195 [Bacillus subtilis]|nr:hypothetical protein [Bacillus subtilis]
MTNPEGGTHEEGFKLTLTRIINNYGRKFGIFKKDESLLGEDTREGLVAIISIKHPDPQFEGQTKAKLGNTDVRRVVSNIMSEGLERFLLENPARRAHHHREGRHGAARPRSRARRPATRPAASRRSTPSASPRKLADCRTKDATRSPRSTSSKAIPPAVRRSRAETREFQAILPLRGKVLNVEKARLDKALGNKEILSMIQAFGTGIGDEFDTRHARATTRSSS